MAGGDKAPIIIKKVKKIAGGGHHGGAWKVAYADFVTAMMAFFLLLWLLNVTTDEQKRGIADYFSPASLARQSSGSGGILGGATLSAEGAMRSQRSQVGLTLELPSSDEESVTKGHEEGALDEDQVENLLAKREEEQFAAAEEALRQAIESVPELQTLAENLLIDQTPEGMRIQIVDQAKKSMFPIGRAEMYHHTEELLALQPRHLAKPIVQVRQVRTANKIETRTKTDNFRDVYLPPHVWKVIEPLRFQEWLFVGEKGKPFTQANRLMAEFQAAHDATGVARRLKRDGRPTPYPWRMTYASILLREGVRPQKVASQLGNDLKTMLDHYAEFLPRDDDNDEIDRATV